MKIAFIGNCQVQSYKKISELIVPDVEFLSFDFSKKDSRDVDIQNEFLKKINGFDYIFMQINNFIESGKVFEFTGQVPVKITNFYFRGLQPEACYMGSFEKRLQFPSDYHNLVVVDSFLRGLSYEECLDSFTAENYARLGLCDAWDASLKVLEDRDKNVTFPGSHLLAEACLEYQAFLTINHPSINLLHSYMRGIFRELSINFLNIEIYQSSDPLRVHDMLCVSDEVADLRKLNYRTTQMWKINSLGGKYIKKEQLIAIWYKTYSNTDRSLIKIHSPGDMVSHLKINDDTKFLL